MNKKKSFIFIFILVSILSLPLLSLAQVGNKTPEETLDSGEQLLKQEQKEVLSETLNRIPLENLKGFDKIKKDREDIHKIRIELMAHLLVLKDIYAKYQKISAYQPKGEETDIKSIFPQGLSLISEEELMKNSPIPIIKEDEKEVGEKIREILSNQGITEFEQIIQDKADYSSLSRFYTKTLANLDEKTSALINQYQDKLEEKQQGEKTFIRQNIVIEFSIGDTPFYSGVKKNFDDGSQLYVSIKYRTEGMVEEIPIEWQITTPQGKINMGKVQLSPGKIEERVQLYEGKIDKGSPSGVYYAQVILFPHEEKLSFKEEYRVGGVPLKITGIATYNANKQPQTTFKPGEEILLVGFYEPYTGRDAKGTFTWKVYSPDGAEVANLCLSKELEMKSTDKSLQSKVIKCKLTQDAMSGDYKYQMIIQCDGETVKSNVVSFRVQGTLKVIIKPDKTRVQVGEKVSLSVQVQGGTKPYQYTWKTDAGETSSQENISLAFTKPGQRWISLTVSDATKPNALKTMERISITVVDK